MSLDLISIQLLLLLLLPPTSIHIGRVQVVVGPGSVAHGDDGGHEVRVQVELCDGVVFLHGSKAHRHTGLVLSLQFSHVSLLVLAFSVASASVLKNVLLLLLLLLLLL